VTPDSPTSVSAHDVLDLIRQELRRPGKAAGPDGDLQRRVYAIREMQRSFRQEPLGGRLVPLKKMVTWFSASAFDRQAKVIEAILDLFEDLVQENEELSARVAELEGRPRTDGRSRDLGPA
jgi:hypothetical protein